MADDVPADNTSYQREGDAPPPAVIVTFKTREPVSIEIDPDLLTWSDLTELTELQARGEKGDLSPREQMDALATLLSKVTGQDMQKQPARVVSALVNELGKLAGGQAEKNAG